jgi:hypothetical protein
MYEYIETPREIKQEISEKLRALHTISSASALQFADNLGTSASENNFSWLLTDK